MNPWRIRALAILFLVMGAAVVGRLAYLQIYQHGFYKALASGQRIQSEPAKGDRGSIVLEDASGQEYTLALDLPVPYLFASPAEVEDPPRAAEVLAQVFGIEEDAVRKGLSAGDGSQFFMIKRELTDEEASQAAALGIPGVYVGMRIERVYPQGSLASHAAGFVNRNGEGQYGVEEYYQEDLRGREGLQHVPRNPAQYLVSGSWNTAEKGSDIRLSLDYSLQTMAEAELDRAQEELGAEDGLVIIADPRDGAIRALAVSPRFDPNKYESVDSLFQFQNPAHQQLYEPGSTFKPLTMAMAIEEGAIEPDTSYTDTGSITIGKYTIRNYNDRSFGRQTMTQVLEFSINTGAVFAQRLLGDRPFLSYMERFGLFEPTGIDLAGEAYSRNQELKKGYEVNYATASFGQGVEITPVQLVRAYSALANGGRLPFLHTASSVERKGTVVRNIDPGPGPRVISRETASKVTGMLVQVIEDGYSKSARIPGYSIAGKTGTSQISWSSMGVDKPGYSDKTVQSFIGYVPAYDPQFVVLVKLGNPRTRTAEYSALPIFRNITQFLITSYQIPPDYDTRGE